jgi:tRNA pseudouridine38-40 synthase
LEIAKNKIVLIVEYDGTDYCGFQFQDNGATIQDELEKALFKLTTEKTRIVGASRTDTGVHARGQVVSFFSASRLVPAEFPAGLDYYLPQDIAVVAAYQVNPEFDVQRSAVSREYLYRIWNRPSRSPLLRRYCQHVKATLDVEQMNEAAQLVVGELDLASFVTELSRSVVRSTVRRVFEARVEREGEEVRFSIRAQSFLPHQVRNTIGSLIRVGLGKMGIEDFKKILEEKTPGLARPTAPAKGLVLVKVNYPRPLGDYHEDL